jgi:gamma-glutamyl-gamma-aminobutyraldehyde dehydrogenase
MNMTTADFHLIKDKAKLTTQAFIDGKFCEASNGAKLETINPATGELITAFTHCGAADVDRAVKAARRVFNEGTWSRSTPEYRKEVLLKLADLVEQNKDELAVLESMDAG